MHGEENTEPPKNISDTITTGKCRSGQPEVSNGTLFKAWMRSDSRETWKLFLPEGTEGKAKNSPPIGSTLEAYHLPVRIVLFKNAS